MKLRFRSSVIFIGLVLVLAVYNADAARGGRGGGYRSSSSRSRTGSSRRSSASTTVRYYSGPTYRTGSWKTAAAVGTVFGLMSYKRRRMYARYPDREPRICFNEKNLRNGTMGYFICPEEYQKDDYAYCCGGNNDQKCCTYTDKSAEGRIAGIVVGVIVACVIVGVVVYCYCVRKRRRQQQAKGGVVISGTKSTGVSGGYVPEQQPLNSGGFKSDGGGVPMQTYNTQPNMGPPQGYDTNAPGLPYASNPGASGMTPYAPAGGLDPYPPPAGMTPYNPVDAPSAPGFAPQPPYAATPAPIGFTDGKPPLPAGDMSGGQPYPPEAPPGSYPGGYPPPSDGNPPLPAGDMSGFQPYPPEAPPGTYPGGYPPPTGPMPTAPPPSYSAT